MCCAAKTGAQELTWQTMNVKNITWRDLGLSPIYMLLDLCCKRHLDLAKLRQEEMGHMITRDKTCLKPTWKPLKYLMESHRQWRKQGKLAWFKMWQTHIAICGKSRRNLGKFSCNLWINSCNWPWELKMCHMFLVPVFETGSLRTFQLSPHMKAACTQERKIQKDTQRERDRDRERERGREGCQKREMDGWRQKMDGWIDRQGRVWGRGGWNRMGVQRMKDWQRGRGIGERGKERQSRGTFGWPVSVIYWQVKPLSLQTCVPPSRRSEC